MNLELMFWGFVQRFGQVLLESALTLVVGALTAGILRRMVGPAGVRKLFGSGFQGLFRGWLAGMLLPVCSLGVIPVAREMKRVGVPSGTVLAFVLAAPLLNPISFLYGLTLAEPKVILIFSLASLFLSTLAGELWTRVFAPASEPQDAARAAQLASQEPLPPPGFRRILAVFVTTCRELVNANLPFYLVGLAGSAVLAAVIPHGALQHSMQHNDPWAPLEMAMYAGPIYSSPLPGMMKIGLMFEHGNSVGASFILFVLGIGINIGLVCWLVWNFSVKRFIPWLAVWIGILLTLAYAAEPLLFDPAQTILDHTHAFDDYTNPFSGPVSQPFMSVLHKLGERFQPTERYSIIALAIMSALGLAIGAGQRARRLERWLTRRPETADSARSALGWDLHLPGPVIGATAIGGLVVLSVIGAYVYYPPPQTTLDQMLAVKADTFVAVNTGHTAEAIKCIEELDDLTRKLQVGVYIRRGFLSEEAAEATSALREAMEEVKDLLEEGELDKARESSKKASSKYMACTKLYREM